MGHRHLTWPFAPGGVWLAIFYIGGLGFIAAASFATPDVVGRPIYGWNLSNFDRVFDPLFLPIVVRTFLYAIAATLMCLIVGYPTAYTIARFGGRYKIFLVLLVLVPWLTDYLVRIYAWVQVLGDAGIMNEVLGISLIGNPAALILGLTYNFLPFMIISIYVSVERLDGRLLEASHDLYAGRFETFRNVTLPITMDGVVAGCLLVFLLALGDFATAQFLGGSTYMLGNLIRDQFATAGSLPFGAALTVTLLVGLVLFSVAGRLLSLMLQRSGARLN
jgi:spermidine/putrescine transport system permease protein